MWKLVRIWILSSWSFLTIGILLGSWWAYHELGWGGWWFWDPVENASLMPWLLATACIHSITKPKLNYWTLISTQATFILSILGTFFVRSGLLSSVHSFATDSTRAQALLFFLLFITSISVFNWISLCFKLVPVPGQEYTRKRASFFDSVLKPVPGQSEMKRSLEQILFLQNFYLSVICIVVFCGTSAPLLFHWLWNRNVGTGAPFYNATVVPLFTSVFFVLVYAHYIQFNMSKSERTSGPLRFVRLAKRVYYCIFFFFLHVLLGASPLIGLNFLDSIYGAICILLISSIIAPAASNKISKRAAYPSEARLRPVHPEPTESTRLPCLPSRHIVLTPKLQFGIQWTRNQHFKSAPHGSSNIIANAPSLDIDATTGNRFLGVRKELYGAVGAPSKRSTRLPQMPQTPQNRQAPLRPAAFLGREAPVQMNVAHTGIVLFILGILLSNTFKLELTEQLHSGPLGIRLGSQVCCLRSIDHSFAPTYHSICANLLVYQQVNIDGLYRLRQAPFAHNLNLQYNSVQTKVRHDAGARVSSLLSLSKVDITACSAPPGSSNGYSDEAPLVRLEGPFMGSVCMFPEKRFYYSNQGAIATKVAIHSNLFTDFYSLIGTGSFETGWFTTIMKLPFIFCIWLGFMFGVFGGALAVKKQLQKSKLFWL